MKQTLKSMTAFVRHQSKSEYGNIIFEIRSVNHRYLEQTIRLPDEFRECEPDLRQLTSQFLQRGKTDVQLRFQPSTEILGDLSLDQALIASLSKASQTIFSLVPSIKPLQTIDVLTWPGVLITKVLDISAIKP